MTDAPATPKADAVPPAKSSPGPVAPVDPKAELRRLLSEELERDRAGFRAALAEASKQWKVHVESVARPYIDESGAIRVHVEHVIVRSPEVPS